MYDHLVDSLSLRPSRHQTKHLSLKAVMEAPSPPPPSLIPCGGHLFMYEVQKVSAQPSAIACTLVPGLQTQVDLDLV